MLNDPPVRNECAAGESGVKAVSQEMSRKSLDSGKGIKGIKKITHTP